VDFLHSRLAPLKVPKVPRWVVISSIAAALVLALVVWAYTDLQSRKAKLADLNSQLDSKQNEVKLANQFVDKVSFAKAWHMGNPRYLACLRDLTNAIPQDGQTYAMSLTLREEVPPVGNGNSTPGSAAPKVPKVQNLTGRLDGKTTETRRAQQLVEQLKAKKELFPDAKLLTTQNASRGDVSFTVTFTYVPPKGT